MVGEVSGEVVDGFGMGLGRKLIVWWALFSWLASLLRSLRRRRVTRGVRVQLGQAVKGSVLWWGDQ